MLSAVRQAFAVAVENLALGEVWGCSDHGHLMTGPHPFERVLVGSRCGCVSFWRKVVAQKENFHRLESKRDDRFRMFQLDHQASIANRAPNSG